ncbi:chondroitinase [Proteus penneri]|uniref:chondroitinase family polysaccharide lyase n=1 Tax=Proteus penneri TaxID=102862 RepID=UPI000D6E9B2B|nr:chondroitinase family polysaccharide lyase [Proteus penneri]QPT33223.1 chondroitinase [Proteus penneri]
MLIKNSLAHAVTLSLCLSLPAQAFSSLSHETFGDIYLFENELPNTLITSNNNQLSLSKQRAKDGEQSLKWQYQPQATLTLNNIVNYQDDKNTATPLTFMMWIYNEKPQSSPLTFAFKQNNKIALSFNAELNFTGWRGIAVPFRDMQGSATGQFEQLVITALDQAETLFFDQIMMSVPLDNRWAVPDYQTPYVNNAVNTMVSKNWSALLMYDQMFKAHYPTLNFNTEFHDAQTEMASIYQRFEYYQGINADKKITSDMLNKNLALWEKLGLTQHADGSITGKALDHPNRQNFMKVEGVFSEETKKTLLDTNMLRDVGKTLLQTAIYLRSNSLSATDRKKLEERYLLGTRYVLEQGFTRGSGYQIITHVGYQTRELFDAWFIGRHILAKNNLLAPTQQAMMWYNATGRIFEKDDEIIDANVDILNTQLQWMIKSLLMLPDYQQRQQALVQLQNWLNKTILSSKGIAGGFKPDGSIFHHSQHYPAYAKDAFGGLAPSVYALSDSPFRLSTSAHERLKDVLLKMRIYTKETQIPVVLSGRHPTGLHKIGIAPFKWMALAGTPDGKQKLDTTLAAAYAKLDNKDNFDGIKAENEPTGAWAMNYASMAIQRRASIQVPQQSWLAIARGFSRYLVGNESYENNNRYGRYLQYGQLEIIPADLTQSGFSHAGWDWNRYPGTTTIHLPYHELEAKLNQLPAVGIEEMLLSTESYSGANTLNNNSMFAMKLHGHSKYQQQSLRANKSYFLFDNRVIALGSGIENNDKQHTTETTLFQFAVPKLQSVSINGKEVNQLGTRLTLNNADTLIDPAGNLYKLAKDQTVEFSYQKQHSLDDRNSKPTEQLFATAVISHGNAPSDATYEYAIAIESQDNKAPEYTVLQHNNQLHAVKDKLTQEEGYAFFESSQVSSPEATILSSNAPVMIMAKTQNQQLTLSIVNPDLNLYQGIETDQVDHKGNQIEVSVYSRKWLTAESQPVNSTITVKGRWKLMTPQSGIMIKHQDNNTLITTTTIQATPIVINLVKSTS